MCCLCHSQSKISSPPLTNGAFLVGEEDAAIAAICVSHVDGVSVCPVEFSEVDRQKKSTRPISNNDPRINILEHLFVSDIDRHVFFMIKYIRVNYKTCSS